ncbi:Ig-like domain-containing protein [Streptomyces violaceusniger]|uniref:Ig-like domain-containing protein n=1 Tax=Streptomyces violaceusniger TaxID=68280 RepID=UPI00382235D2
MPDRSRHQNLQPSSAADTHQVVRAVSTTVVTGEPVTFTATVSAAPPASGTPTGTVTFDFGDGTTPVVLPLTGGTATTGHACTIAAGCPYTVTANYNGDVNYATSSASIIQTVTPGQV